MSALLFGEDLIWTSTIFHVVSLRVMFVRVGARVKGYEIAPLQLLKVHV